MELQKTNVGIFYIKRKMEEETTYFRLDERGVLWFKDRLVDIKIENLETKS